MTRQRIELALAALPALVVGILGFTHRWTSDLGFAYFRVVDQITDGNGPVFNAGERVEAVSSPLWLVVLTVGDMVSPIRLEVTAAVLSLVATVSGIVLATAGSRRLMRRADDDAFLLPVGAAVIAVLWPVWVWSTGGVEIGLCFAWLGGCLLILSRWATGSRAHTSGWHLCILGLGWLVRPELALSSIIMVGTVVILSDEARAVRWRQIALAVALPAVYQVFRMGYYGALLPTDWIARDATTARPGIGWGYFLNFVGPYLLAIPLLALLFAVVSPYFHPGIGDSDRRPRAVIVAVGGGGVVHGAFVVAVGGDYIHARLLLPALFAFLAPLMALPARRRYVEAIAAVGVWMIVAAFALRPPATDETRPIADGYVEHRLTYEDLGFEQRGIDQRWIDGTGLYLTSAFEPDGFHTDVQLADDDSIVVLAEAAGPIGYVLGTSVNVIDLHGASDPLIAHQDRSVELAPGIEKGGFAPWLLARLAATPTQIRPDQLFVQPPGSSVLAPLTFVEQTSWAQAALSCDGLHELQQSTEDSLTVGRFVSNLWSSFSNTSLRISVLPVWAASQHCDQGVPPDVAAYYNAVLQVDDLPETSDDGLVAVVGQCASAYMASGLADDPWTPIEAPTMTAGLSLDPFSPVRDTVPLYAIEGRGSEVATASVELDGEGMYRLLLRDGDDEAALEWTEISDDPVEIAVVGDTFRRVWTLTVNGVPVGDVNMVVDRADGSPSARTPVDQAIADDVETSVSVEFRQRVTSVPCQSILDNT